MSEYIESAGTWLPCFSVPVGESNSSCRWVKPFPPHSSIARLTNISEHRVFGDGGHGVWVGLVRSAGSNSEEPVLWVDGPEFAYGGTEFDLANWRMGDIVVCILIGLHSP